MDAYERGAADIIASMEAIYVPTHEYATVDASQFKHLNLKFYRTALAELERHGYTHLMDVEDLTINNAPRNIMTRIMIRTMLSADGKTMAAAYDPKLKLGWRILLTLLRMNPKPVLDFETEFSDGAFVATSNAQGASVMKSPPLILTEYFPNGTAASVLLARHDELVSAYADLTGAEPRTVSSHEEMVHAQNRMNAIKAAYRDELGGISREELERASGRWADAAGRIHEKVVEIRQRKTEAASQ